MSKQKQLQTTSDESVVSALILNGDLSKLSAADKIKYYNGYCDRLGLDPFTKPFDILRLNGKEVLYCTRIGSQQLNKLHGVSHSITSREVIEVAGVYQVTARASMPDGRFTESIGATNIASLKGEAYANAIMKAETKAKRRATLDLLGLGVLDETEAEDIGATGQIVKVQEKLHEEKAVEDFGANQLEDFCRRAYETEADVEMVLGMIETQAQLKNLYYLNQKLVDSSANLKSQFKNKQNDIKQQSAA